MKKILTVLVLTVLVSVVGLVVGGVPDSSMTCLFVMTLLLMSIALVASGERRS